MRRGRKRKPYTEIDVVDLFCGIGGLSYGMKSKGFHIQGGFDLDKTCRFAYEYNNEAPFFYKDVKEVTKKDITFIVLYVAVAIIYLLSYNNKSWYFYLPALLNNYFSLVSFCSVASGNSSITVLFSIVS